jgi:hypothetical protein
MKVCRINPAVHLLNSLLLLLFSLAYFSSSKVYLHDSGSSLVPFLITCHVLVKLFHVSEVLLEYLPQDVCCFGQSHTGVCRCGLSTFKMIMIPF